MAVRICFLLLTLLAVRPALAGDGCRRELLSDEEKAQLATVVMRHTRIAANLATINACKDTGSVWLETFRAPQKNGAERWFHLWCSRMRAPWPEPWHCIEYPHYGFRADTYPGEPGVWVGIEANANLDAARRDVAQAFALLAGTGDVPICPGDPKDPKTVEGLRAEFTQGDGFLTFGGTEKSFALEHGWVRLEFERAGREGDLPRLKCWFPVEVVVTS